MIGAGGGGFLMFYDEDKGKLRQAMKRLGLIEVRVRFDFDGSTVVARIARVPQAGAPTNRPLTRVSIDSVRIVRSPQGAAGLRAAPAATSPASVPPAGTGPVHRNASPPPRSTLRVNP